MLACPGICLILAGAQSGIPTHTTISRRTCDFPARGGGEALQQCRLSVAVARISKVGGMACEDSQVDVCPEAWDLSSDSSSGLERSRSPRSRCPPQSSPPAEDEDQKDSAGDSSDAESSDSRSTMAPPRVIGALPPGSTHAPPRPARGMEWWSCLLYTALENERSKRPSQPIRALSHESLCSGTLCERFGCQAPWSAKLPT